MYSPSNTGVIYVVFRLRKRYTIRNSKNVILIENYHPLEMSVIRVNGTLSTTERWAPLPLVCKSKSTLCFKLNHRVIKGVSQSLALSLIHI